jgi:phospholipase D1/2
VSEALLREGRNCWCIRRADRVALIVDGAAYYAALAQAIEAAERSIWMIGWDFHSRVRLRRAVPGQETGQPQELLALLERAVRRRSRLRVRILAWDYAMIYALEREMLPLVRFEARSHPRIRFHLDDSHPVGASHHQKLVVVDDALAFCGGLDVTACRWDTREHRGGDPRRSDAGFGEYAPFHDVQMAVDGEAARALSELARSRWHTATDRLVGPLRGRFDPWPRDLAPALRDVHIGVSRTAPRHGSQGEVREIESLYVDALRSARRAVYLENQYLTSHAVGDVLAERLSGPKGPEVVIVLPRELSGWLEGRTMGVLQAHLVRRLRAADRHGRLRIYQPRLPGETPLLVHSKLFVVDDRVLHVGSANASNRSMGLDTECGLTLESTPQRDVRAAIEGFRNDLLAEHLGSRRQEVAAALRERGSLVASIESLRGGARSLEDLEPELERWLDVAEPVLSLADPEQPIGLAELRQHLGTGRDPDEPAAPGTPAQAWLRLAAGVAVAALGVAAWRFTPLGDLLGTDRLALGLAGLGDGPVGVAVGALLFALAASLFAPVTALIAASAVVFGFGRGLAVSALGSLASAAIGYAAGRALWRDSVRHLAGRRLDLLGRRLARRGVLAVAALRLVPLAPYTLFNLVAGASRIGARDFLLGTLLGMAPGAIALSLAADRARAAIADPGPWTFAVAAAALGLALAGLWWTQRRVDTEASADRAR